MLRICAVLAVVWSSSAFAVTVTDGSDRRLPPEMAANVKEAAGYSPYIGANGQLRGLHQQKSENRTIVCGQAYVNGVWQGFYWDPFNGATRVGEGVGDFCGR